MKKLVVLFVFLAILTLSLCTNTLPNDTPSSSELSLLDQSENTHSVNQLASTGVTKNTLTAKQCANITFYPQTLADMLSIKDYENPDKTLFFTNTTNTENRTFPLPHERGHSVYSSLEEEAAVGAILHNLLYSNSPDLLLTALQNGEVLSQHTFLSHGLMSASLLAFENINQLQLKQLIDLGVPVDIRDVVIAQKLYKPIHIKKILAESIHNSSLKDSWVENGITINLALLAALQQDLQGLSLWLSMGVSSSVDGLSITDLIAMQNLALLDSKTKSNVSLLTNELYSGNQLSHASLIKLITTKSLLLTPKFPFQYNGREYVSLQQIECLYSQLQPAKLQLDELPLKDIFSKEARELAKQNKIYKQEFGSFTAILEQQKWSEYEAEISELLEVNPTYTPLAVIQLIEFSAPIESIEFVLKGQKEYVTKSVLSQAITHERKDVINLFHLLGVDLASTDEKGLTLADIAVALRTSREFSLFMKTMVAHSPPSDERQ